MVHGKGPYGTLSIPLHISQLLLWVMGIQGDKNLSCDGDPFDNMRTTVGCVHDLHRLLLLTTAPSSQSCMCGS